MRFVLMLCAAAVVISLTFSSEISDRIKGFLFSRSEPMCVSFELSGRKFCLPKEKVRLGKGGPHIQVLFLTEERYGQSEPLQLLLSDQRSLKNLPNKWTYPEWVVDNVTNTRVSPTLLSDAISSGWNDPSKSSLAVAGYLPLSSIFSDVKIESGSADLFLKMTEGRLSKFIGLMPTSGNFNYYLRHVSNPRDESVTIEFYYLSNGNSIEQVFEEAESIDIDIRNMMNVDAL